MLRPARPASAPVGPAVRRCVVLAGLLAGMLASAARAAPMADRPGSPAGIDIPPSTSAGSTLDRTLQVDTEAGQRNVELLLDTTIASEAALPPPAARQQPLPAATTAAPADGAQRGGLPPVPTAARAPERPAPSGPVRNVVQFLREHRLWLLGAVGLLAAAVVGVRALRRRGTEASEARLRRLAEQHRAPHGSRRRRRR